MSENAYSLLPREVELAQKLKELDLEWEVMTGDWFFADEKLHVVMRKENSAGKINVYGIHDHAYDLERVVFLPHPSQCQQWLNERLWDLKMTDVPGSGVKLVAVKRGTDYKIEKHEPTQMAALYAAMIDAIDLAQFGWG